MPDDSARAALDDTRFGAVRWVDEVGSTNDEAAAAARSGSAGAFVVVADHQIRGRGRRGRIWEAPPGSSLLVSVAVPSPWPAEMAHLPTVAMALAALFACDDAEVAEVGIKWPNDLVAGALGKLGGVLGERIAGHAVIGLGLNVDWGTALPAGWVDVARLVRPRPPPQRESLLVALLVHLDRLLDTRAADLIAALATRCVTLGQAVRVETATGSFDGEAVELTPEGYLVVDAHDGGRRVLSAADVMHVGQPPTA